MRAMWHAAVSAYYAADEALEAPSDGDEKPDDEAKLCALLLACREQMMATPAPDVAALAFKLRLAADHVVADPAAGELAAIMRDAERLAGVA